jgi:hypothetical protein
MTVKILKTLAVLIMVPVFAFFYVQTVGAVNRWRYAQRAMGRASARLPMTFYIRPSGSDASSGTSPDRAWQSIAKVNQTSFVPGDSILFEGGKELRGNLVFGSDDLGTPAKPIHVSSFGLGLAKLFAGSGNGIYVHNSGGFKIDNLMILGSGRESNAGDGIIFQDDLLGRVKIPYVRIDSVEATGFGKYGICVAGNRWKSGFRDVRITRVSAHDNALAGIYIYGGFVPNPSEHAHRDIYVGYSSAFNNSGLSGPKRENSGSGIVLSDVDSGIIERNIAFNNGWLSNSKIGGPVGIWTWDSDFITIQFNRSYNNHSSGPYDGGGFDLDGAVTNSIVQYNYSHDNDGAGYLICEFPGGRPPSKNVVRYNVSQDDARRNRYGAIDLYGAVQDAEIYNNTIVVDAKAQGSPVPVKVDSGSRDVHLRNNIFYVAKELSVVQVQPHQNRLLFQGNAYISPTWNLRIEWEDSEFKKLSDWRAATGQEILGSHKVGIEAQAQLANSQKPSDVDGYLLPYRSSLVDAGLDLRALFGINPGKCDYYGFSIPSGSAFDIGAHEWPVSQ